MKNCVIRPPHCSAIIKGREITGRRPDMGKLCSIRKALFGEEDEKTQAAMRGPDAPQNREKAQNG